MKYRDDFVTNSSSSLFMIAKRPGLSERQKEALLDFVESTFIGVELVASVDSDEAIEEALAKLSESGYLPWYAHRDQLVRDALREGKGIHVGCVNFEGPDDLAYLYQRVWKILLETQDDEHAVTIIDGDLDY